MYKTYFMTIVEFKLVQYVQGCTEKGFKWQLDDAVPDWFCSEHYIIPSTVKFSVAVIVLFW